jgi:phage-related protein
MMHKWKVIFYETDKGKCPVQDFIASRSLNNRVKIFALISFLEEKGPNLPRPYADFLEDGIHELRIKLSGDQIRILYFFCYKDFIILAHPFIKKSNKVPISEINKANKLRSDFLRRYNEIKLIEAYNENI